LNYINVTVILRYQLIYLDIVLNIPKCPPAEVKGLGGIIKGGKGGCMNPVWELLR